jgi:hypothetical protein
MLTIFTVTKPFEGPISVIQRNALLSWTQLVPGCQIILFGNEPGLAAAAHDFHADHVPEVPRNEFGTPLLDGVFTTAERLARHPFLCYANADLIFFRDLPAAVSRIAQQHPRFLAVGECWNLDVTEPLPLDTSWEPQLRQQVAQQGRRRGRSALDFFLFPRGFYWRYLPLALGRAAFDSWLVREARAQGDPVVEMTPLATVIHQNHAYTHLKGGKEESRVGVEAQRNIVLAGGSSNLYTLDDATHRLRGNQLRPHWGRWGRLAHRWTRLKLRLGGAIRA